MSKKNNKKYRMVWIMLSVILAMVVAVILFINQPSFGRAPSGERLERIKKSENYRDGQFRNQREMPQFTSDEGYIKGIFDFLFGKKEGLRPQGELPVVKTDLWKLDRNKDLFIWFGHSSYLIQIDGKRILVDPVFCKASPVSFINKPFKGTDIYLPEDIPDIDYLVISHDHWDHLDYQTVLNLKKRIRKVICPLGVGEYFEYWGFDKDQLVELDWKESEILDGGFRINCLPAHHFSGRSFSRNLTLWASYMVQTPSMNIYIGGDGGYGAHFEEIGKQYPQIDIAILENGQYNKDWKYIHLMPNDLIKASKELNAKQIFAVHNSKYALAKHPWDEPLINVEKAVKNDSLNMFVPIIGKPVYFNERSPL